MKGVQLHRTAMTDLQSDRHGNLSAAVWRPPSHRDPGPGHLRRAALGHPAWPASSAPPTSPTTVRRWAGSPPARLPGQLLCAATRRSRQDTGLELRKRLRARDDLDRPGTGGRSAPRLQPGLPGRDLLERMRPIYKKVIDYARAMGLDMIEGDYEDPGQLELNWLFDHATLTADRLITYRQICQPGGPRELGVKASFMPKPATGTMGNGCHHNLSLWDGDENAFAEPGRRELHLSKVGRARAGRLLAHAAGSMAVMASTVNSYKRFWDGGQFAPSTVNWGMDNKTCTVRLSAERTPGIQDSRRRRSTRTCPTPLLLAAIKDGLDNASRPREPQVGSSYDNDESARHACR